MRRLLYVTWDGPGQSYLPSLFFPVFSGLAAHGYQIDVLQNTYASRTDTEATAQIAAARGLRYQAHHVLPAWRRFGLPAIVTQGALRILRIARDHDIEAIVPRSLIPAAMALLARRLAPRLRLILDTDGLMADERVEFTGLSPQSVAYRLLREVEAQALRSADAVIVRTNRADSILRARAGAGTSAEKFFVVPNGKDTSLFSPRDAEARAHARAARGHDSTAPWIVYVGSLGPQYYPEAMLRLVSEVRARRADVRLSLFTRHQEAAEELLRASGTGGVDVAALPPEHVPEVLAAADLGLALRATSFSQGAVSPIKVAEYLLCGTPVLASPVGDLDVQLTRCVGALLVSEPSPAELARAAEWFVNEVLPQREAMRRACRDRGLEWFSLESSVKGYAAALAYAFASHG